MDEHRKRIRLRTYKGGRINFESGVGIDCLIRNLSDTGACLDVDTALIWGDRFQLVIRPENVTRNCRVAWRQPKKLGVRFV
jgi:hypothetical protein